MSAIGKGIEKEINSLPKKMRQRVREIAQLLDDMVKVDKELAQLAILTVAAQLIEDHPIKPSERVH